METVDITSELIKRAKETRTKQEFNSLKHKLARKYKLKSVPKNTDLIASLKTEKVGEAILKTKPVRTISGVAPVAIMAAPIACPPQAQCTYCPGGPGSVFGYVPKSYTKGAPAVNRAIRNHYDPYLQVFNRLEHYVLLKQNPTKVELIIMGGTFPSFAKIYRDQFIAYAFKAMNDFSMLFFNKNKFDKKKFNEFFLLPGNREDVERTKKIQEKLLKLKTKTTLEIEKKRNETANIRSVALVIETRPDCSLEPEINEMLNSGTTRIELGVQSIYNDVLEKIKRGHTVETTIKAIQLAKDALLKVGYHIMLGLPGATKESDIAMGKELFSNPDFRPDALKMYPCMVMRGTPLYEDWKKNKYIPITTEEAIERIIVMKKFVQPYCRIMRIQRDLPTYMTEAGVDRTNLRQMIHDRMAKAQEACICIRCREPRNREIAYDHVKTKVNTYEASQGTEMFITREDVKNNLLLGYCRLRMPSSSFRKEITPQSAGIRELHVFGDAVNMNTLPKETEVQHRGIGKLLMQKAEKIAREEFDKNKMVVIAGVGVREYYRKQLQYIQEGPYVVKTLN